MVLFLSRKDRAKLCEEIERLREEVAKLQREHTEMTEELGRDTLNAMALKAVADAAVVEYEARRHLKAVKTGNPGMWSDSDDDFGLVDAEADVELKEAETLNALRAAGILEKNP